MRLFIAEKPSLARAIADVLPKPHRKGDGFIECGNGQVVTWCIGHLLEQAQPDVYDSRYARWNLTDLPIVPEKWRLQPRPSVTKQLNVIKRFLHEADEVVHAGDPDREGQLLVDEVLDYLELAPEKRQQVQRCLINDLNPQAVERAILAPARQQRVYSAVRLGAGPCPRRLAVRHQHDPRLHPPGAQRGLSGRALGGARADAGAGAGGASRRRDRKLRRLKISLR